MTRIRSLISIALISVVFPVLIGSVPSCRGERSEKIAMLRQAVFEAEDSRAQDAASLKILVDALIHSDAGIRRTAVRALGRLVRPELAERIAPLLNDAFAGVRAEAANALAQSVTDLKTAGPNIDQAAKDDAVINRIFDLLDARLKIESDPVIRGVIFRTIGRLSYPDEPSYRRAEKIFLSAAAEEVPENYGVAKGMEALLRRKPKPIQPDEIMITRLKTMVLSRPTNETGDEAGEDESARLRRLALMALAWAGRLDEATLEAALSDPDDQVRRLVFFGWGRMGSGAVSPEAAERLTGRGLADRSDAVCWEALRMLGRTKIDRVPSAALAGLDDSSPHVALLAIDLLGQMNKAPEDIIGRLIEIAGLITNRAKASSPLPPRTKLMSAHALVSLAKIAPDRAVGMLPDFLQTPDWVVRTYAASAAAVLKDVSTLERLTGDPHDNVRNEALSGLIGLRGREADEECLAALERDDFQLILTAVGGLKGSRLTGKAVPALVSTLARLTARRKETSRDPRLAILERLGELGSEAQAEELAAYVEDFDPPVASAAADLVARWTGKKSDVHSRPLPIAFPRLADIEKLRPAKVRVTMADGAAFEMKLLVDETPATVARFAALVRSRYYDGLTIHRIVPNFLVQGGSPGANEFAGDARFMRDESGLASNIRGTVGISTRGRDTGDAQIYVNTVDNDRLDHDYCIFARVTAGMEVVDRILEGDMIERIEIFSEEDQYRSRTTTGD